MSLPVELSRETTYSRHPSQVAGLHPGSRPLSGSRGGAACAAVGRGTAAATATSSSNALLKTMVLEQWDAIEWFPRRLGDGEVSQTVETTCSVGLRSMRRDQAQRPSDAGQAPHRHVNGAKRTPRRLGSTRQFLLQSGIKPCVVWSSPHRMLATAREQHYMSARRPQCARPAEQRPAPSPSGGAGPRGVEMKQRGAGEIDRGRSRGDSSKQAKVGKRALQHVRGKSGRG